MSMTLQQAAEAFQAAYGRAPEAELADSCWLAGYAAAIAPSVTATVIREHYNHDPPLSACLVLVETRTGQWRERIVATDLDLALRFLRCGVEMSGGRLDTVELGPLSMGGGT